MSGPRHISEVMAETPIVRLLLARRLDDPNWPTAQDIADAHWGLSHPNAEVQPALPLGAPKCQPE